MYSFEVIGEPAAVAKAVENYIPVANNDTLEEWFRYQEHIVAIIKQLRLYAQQKVRVEIEGDCFSFTTTDDLRSRLNLRISIVY